MRGAEVRKLLLHIWKRQEELGSSDELFQWSHIRDGEKRIPSRAALHSSPTINSSTPLKRKRSMGKKARNNATTLETGDDDRSSDYSDPSWLKLHTIAPASDHGEDGSIPHDASPAIIDSPLQPAIRIGGKQRRKKVIESSEDESTTADVLNHEQGHRKTAAGLSQPSNSEGTSSKKSSAETLSALQSIDVEASVKTLREAILNAGLVLPGRIKSRKNYIQFIKSSIAREERLNTDKVADSLIKGKSQGGQPEKFVKAAPKKKNRPPPVGENPDDIIVGSSRRSRNALEKKTAQQAK